MVPVPPLALAVAEPFVPKHNASVSEAILTLTDDEGCVIVTLPISLQPLLSSTVIVYVEAVLPEIVEVVSPEDHAYVYGAVPPLGAD